MKCKNCGHKTIKLHGKWYHTFQRNNYRVGWIECTANNRKCGCHNPEPETKNSAGIKAEYFAEAFGIGGKPTKKEIKKIKEQAKSEAGHFVYFKSKSGRKIRFWVRDNESEKEVKKMSEYRCRCRYCHWFVEGKCIKQKSKGAEAKE